MRIKLFIILAAILVLAACARPSLTSLPSEGILVLTNGMLIDGTGSDPLPRATLVIKGDHIAAAGPDGEVAIPPGAKVIDLQGATILPGFINAHVHDAYDEERLEAWAKAGVTTVRDEGILSGSGQFTSLIALRDQWASSPKYARLVSAGYMLTVPGGYGHLEVLSPDDARQQVNMELDAGADLLKLAMESGYAGATNLPNLSSEELAAIVESAHARGKLVSAHITDKKYLDLLLEAGVDDLAHIPYGDISEAQFQQLIEQDIYVVSTLTVFEAYGVLEGDSKNLDQLLQAGVQIAMGNDYTFHPQNNFDHFDLGMPMHEITRMSEAGMTPMQIIIASTRNAAHVCGLDNILGTLKVGMLADLLIVNGNPLADLSVLTQVKMVIHSGVIIRP